jgi:hypothetical protein
VGSRLGAQYRLKTQSRINPHWENSAEKALLGRGYLFRGQNVVLPTRKGGHALKNTDLDYNNLTRGVFSALLLNFDPYKVSKMNLAQF